MENTLRPEDEAGGVMVAVGYVRCAVDGVETEEAVEAQKAKIQEFAEGHTIKVIDWHVDVGYSGNNLNRPALQTLLTGAQMPDCGFNMVLVSALNRLSRRAHDVVTVRTALSESEIRLVSVAEAEFEPMEKFASDMLKAMDGFYRESQAQVTGHGLLQAAQKGYCVVARAPYGYRKVEVNDGGQRRSKLEIDPETAEVVRAMYDRAGEGASPRVIATELNNTGVPSPSGGTWDSRKVRRILLNSVYAGVIVIGKNSDAPFEVLNAHLKIVCRAVVEKVRELLQLAVRKANPRQG